MSKVKNIGKEKSNAPYRMINYTVLQNADFIPVMNKLGKCNFFKSSTALQIHKLLQGLRNKNGELRKKTNELIETYGKKGEDGELIKDPNGGGIHMDESPEYIEAFENLMRTEFQIPNITIKINDFPSNVFAPYDFVMLENVLTIPSI